MELILDTFIVIGAIYFVLCLFMTYIYFPIIEYFKTDKELEDNEWLKKNIHNIRGL